MKKILSFLCIIYTVLSLSTHIYALENKNSISSEYLGNGIYLETIIEEDISLFSTKTKNGSKTNNYKDSKGNILYSIKVSGSFSYTGSSSTCTSASVSTSVSNSYWKITSKSASKSGNTAIGKATAKRYSLGFVVETRNETVTLTCSSTGKLS